MVFGNLFNRTKNFFSDIYGKTKQTFSDIYDKYKEVKQLPVFSNIISNLESNLVKVGNKKIDEAFKPYLNPNPSTGSSVVNLGPMPSNQLLNKV
jgi:hypothetical protein